MHLEQFAVVRVDIKGVFIFSKFHDTLEIVKSEALRLAEKEECRFIVLKVIGYADKKPMPVEWYDF